MDLQVALSSVKVLRVLMSSAHLSVICGALDQFWLYREGLFGGPHVFPCGSVILRLQSVEHVELVYSEACKIHVLTFSICILVLWQTKAVNCNGHRVDCCWWCLASASKNWSRMIVVQLIETGFWDSPAVTVVQHDHNNVSVVDH